MNESIVGGVHTFERELKQARQSFFCVCFCFCYKVIYELVEEVPQNPLRNMAEYEEEEHE